MLFGRLLSWLLFFVICSRSLNRRLELASISTLSVRGLLAGVSLSTLRSIAILELLLSLLLALQNLLALHPLHHLYAVHDLLLLVG